eukprot:scaffold52103_cov60-Phaeocystis_antarctica.AAC.4
MASSGARPTECDPNIWLCHFPVVGCQHAHLSLVSLEEAAVERRGAFAAWNDQHSVGRRECELSWLLPTTRTFCSAIKNVQPLRPRTKLGCEDKINSQLLERANRYCARVVGARRPRSRFGSEPVRGHHIATTLSTDGATCYAE